MELKKVTLVKNAQGETAEAYLLTGDGPEADLLVKNGNEAQIMLAVPRRAKGADGEDAGRTWH